MSAISEKANKYGEDQARKIRALFPAMTVNEELYWRSELALAYVNGVNEGVDLFSDYMMATEHLR